MKHIAHLLAVSLLLSPVAMADVHKDLLRRAHAGDAVAMRKIGIRKFKGAPGTPIDRDNGIAWLQKAADKNDADAMYFLGMLYLKGTAVGKNPKKAGELFAGAAERGHEKAKEKIVELPLDISLPVIEKDAKKGDIKANLRIAKAYLSGKDGLGFDENKGVKFAMEAYKRDAGATKKGLKKWSQKIALPAWEKIAQTSKDEEVIMYLAELYDKGDKDVKTDVEKAKEYYSEAATNGNNEAVAWMKEHNFPFMTAEEKRMAEEVAREKKLEEERAERERRRQAKLAEQEEYRSILRKAFERTGKRVCTFLTITDGVLNDVTLSVEQLENLDDLERFFAIVYVRQKIGENHILAITRQDVPVSIRIREGLDVNHADGDKINAVLVRDGEYTYETVSGQYRTVRNYVIVLGAN